jgi:predicted Zn finger-like uncharacterized protein
MSLATRCTACGIAFRVVQDQLRVSEGWVRCGQCREVFNALEQLFDLDRDGWPAQARVRPHAPATPDALSPPAASDPAPGPSGDGASPMLPRSDASDAARPGALAAPPAAVPDESVEQAASGVADAATAVEVLEPDVAAVDSLSALPGSPFAEVRGDAAPPTAPADAAAAAVVDLAALGLPSLDLPAPGVPAQPRSAQPVQARSEAARPTPAESAAQRTAPAVTGKRTAQDAPPRASELLAFESLDDDEAPLLPPLDADAPERNREAVPSLYATLDELATVPDAATFLAPEFDDADGDDTIRLAEVPAATPPAPVRDPDVAVDEWAVDAAHERPSTLQRSIDQHLSRKRRHARRHAPVVHVSARDQLDFSDARFDSKLLEEDGLLAGIEPTAPAPAPEPALETPPETAVTPEFLRRAERRAHWRTPAVRAGLIAASIALGALLALQGVNHFRDDLAVRWQALRPVLVAWCGVAGCRLEAPRRIDDLTVENSALARANADAFRLAVTLRNHASVPVALPLIELSLNDASGVLVARRALEARDFKAQEVLPPNGEATLQAPIAVRNLRVSGYTVAIFYP